MECPLSEQQLHVMRLLLQGLPYKQIAALLEVTESAIKTTLMDARRALGVETNVQMAVWLSRNGWLDEEGLDPSVTHAQRAYLSAVLHGSPLERRLALLLILAERYRQFA